MLHVTSTAALAAKLSSAHLSGHAISWDDPLHDGPVPDGRRDQRLHRRALHAEQAGWGDSKVVEGWFEKRDADFNQACGRGDELVLWFEPGLVGQLHLLDVLHRLTTTANLATLVPIPNLLTDETPAELIKLFPLRRGLSSVQLKQGSAAWAAFTAPDPSGLPPIAAQVISPLADLPAAMRRHLEEFPSIRNGLSRLDQSVLTLAGEKARSSEELRAAVNDEEDCLIWDETTFGHRLRALASARIPAIRLTKGGAVKVTDAGKSLADGEADWTALNGIDRWLGGVHLTGADSRWRWDSSSRTLVAGW